MSQLSHAQFPLRRHPDLLVDHRRARSAAVAEPRGANVESGDRLRWPASFRNRGRDQIGTVADIKSESPAGLRRNSQVTEEISKRHEKTVIGGVVFDLANAPVFALNNPIHVVLRLPPYSSYLGTFRPSAPCPPPQSRLGSPSGARSGIRQWNVKGSVKVRGHHGQANNLGFSRCGDGDGERWRRYRPHGSRPTGPRITNAVFLGWG